MQPFILQEPLCLGPLPGTDELALSRVTTLSSGEALLCPCAPILCRVPILACGDLGDKVAWARPRVWGIGVPGPD